jgi:photosystem II stability/assembly factor-like uncharacterized protein
MDESLFSCRGSAFYTGCVEQEKIMMGEISAEAEIQDIVYALAASPNFARDGVCFAARYCGLYRSEDGGATWRCAYDSLGLEEELNTTAVTVSPDFESDQTVFAGAQGAVLRSVDGGENWTVTYLTSPPPVVSTLVTSPHFAHDDTLFVGTVEDGVFLSSDRGGHFHRWNFGLLDLNVLAVAISPAFADDETLFVGTETGIFRSTNGGRAWREVNFPIAYAPVISLAISPDYANDGVLFAGTESFGLFRSDDRGQTWARLGEGVIADLVNDVVLSLGFPATPDILAVLGAVLLISRDGGQSWTDWKVGLNLEQGVSAVAAPQGLEPGAPLLVGFVGGDVLRL